MRCYRAIRGEIMIDKRTVDSAVAAILMAIGLAQLWGGFTMERLEVRRIHPTSIPGLVPMMLGVAMFVLAVIVFMASRKQAPAGDDSPDSVFGFGEIKSFLIVATLAGIYALGLVGTVHFWLASSLFVFTFIMVAEWPRLETMAARLKTGAIAAVIAVSVTGGISYMFEQGFLVRLP